MRCPICLSPNTLHHERENLSRCPTCMHMFQGDLTPTVAYGKEYGDRTYNTYDGRATALMRAAYVASLGRQHHVAQRVVDFGFGNGSFLRAMRDLGWCIEGIDVHQEEPDIPRATVPIHYGPVVTYFDSLEHLINPGHIVSELPASIAIVSVPLCPEDFWNKPSAWKHFKPGEHLHYFTITSLHTLFSMRGYRLIDRNHLEDATRGKLPNGEPNILTAAFLRDH